MLSIPVGVLFAVLSVNLYFPLTALLEMDDFYWM